MSTSIDSMPLAGLSGGDRSERLRCFIEEFDVEVQSRCDQMTNGIGALRSGIKKRFAIELIKLPKKIRNMSLADFQSRFGGSVEAVKQSQLIKAVAQLNTVQLPPVPRSSVKRAAAGTKRRAPLSNVNGGNDVNSSNSSNNNNDFATPAAKRAASRSATMPSTGRRTSSRLASKSRIATANSSNSNSGGGGGSGKNVTKNATSTTTLESLGLDASSFVTPAPRKASTKIATTTAAAAAVAAAAVASTPAFDPRLPKTPMVRMPRHGESMMSMNGSPLAADTRTARVATTSSGRSASIMVPLSNGKAIAFDPSADLDVNTKGLSKRARKEAVSKLAALQNQVASLMAQLTGSSA